jgi:hypothetical protein
MQRDDNSEDKNMYVAICRSDVRNLLVGLVWFLAFNATFNSISVISWQSVLLVEETSVSGQNHQQTLSHNVTLPERGSNSQHMVIGIDCTGS